MIAINIANVCLSLLLLTLNVNCHDLKAFDDTILYEIFWPGQLIDPVEDSEPLYVTTHNKEKYKCLIPSLTAKESEQSSAYSGPAPLDLIAPLFTLSACSYRIESYWTYEICHGNYIKQYHEEREGKIMKTQEYFLGKWDKTKTDFLRKETEKFSKPNEKLKYKKIDGANLPYLELEMSDGTLCDINNEPRVTKVLYVCYTHGKNEIYSLKETSTCNYEVIVLTHTLCIHPKFRPQAFGENHINCLPLNDAPTRPRSLLTMVVESLKLRYQKLTDAHKSAKETIAILKVDAKDGSFRLEMVPNDFDPAKISEAKTVAEQDELIDAILKKEIQDTSPVNAFLQGKNCLNGGTGWWKYEFCYGRYVRQYHSDKNGETSVILGFFDEAAHKEYLKKNPQKSPKPNIKRTQLIHFYQGGSVCDKTGKKRQTEVKLKCLENSSSPASVSLYLLEPQTCQYILGVESPLICDILDKADNFGLVPKENVHSVDSEETPAEYIIDKTVINDPRLKND